MPLNKEQNRERMRLKRGAQMGAQNGEVHSPGAQVLPPTWAYINKHGLEKVQAIVTSLGKYASEVFLGNVSAKQIRNVIGEGPAIVQVRGGLR